MKCDKIKIIANIDIQLFDFMFELTFDIIKICYGCNKKKHQ